MAHTELTDQACKIFGPFSQESCGGRRLTCHRAGPSLLARYPGLDGRRCVRFPVGTFQHPRRANRSARGHRRSTMPYCPRSTRSSSATSRVQKNPSPVPLSHLAHARPRPRRPTKLCRQSVGRGARVAQTVAAAGALPFAKIPPPCQQQVTA